MFAAGDKVVYPLHGGAIIKEIKIKEQDGNDTAYYILQMLFENMVVAIPVSNAERLGLRSIGDNALLKKVEAVLRQVPDVQSVKSISWNRRFQLYMARIKSGDILEVAKIFKLLSIMENNKKISVGERRLLHNTKQILQSEIMLIRNVDADAANQWLDACCAG